MKPLLKTICIAVIVQTVLVLIIFVAVAYNSIREHFPPREIGISAKDLIKVGDFRKTVCWECHKASLEY